MAISKLKEAKSLAEKFNDLESDIERILFIKKHNDKMGVLLDNDNTSVTFLIDENLEEEEQDLFSEIELNGFDDFCGDDDLTYTLWGALNINAEPV